MAAVIRLLATLLGMVWAVFAFGLIDLSVMLTWDVEFLPVLPLEASWGALVTFFIAMPFLVVAVRPARWGDLAVIAALVVLASCLSSILTGDPAVLWLAGGVVLTAGGIAVAGFVGIRTGELAAIPWRLGLDIPIGLLGVVALPLWGLFVQGSAQGSRGLPSDVTLGLDHWPVHVAAGLLVPTAALLAAFTGRLRILAAIAAALTAITIGVAMASSQSFDVATESAHWSVLAVLWGSALLLAVIWAMGRKIRRRDDAEPSVEAVEG